MKYNIFEPNLTNKERIMLNKAFDKKLISTYGNFQEKFEKEFKKIKKFKYCISLNSGTSALQLALNVEGIKKDDLVILPSYTFAATANSIIYNGAKPWFFDINKKNLCLDLKQVELTLSKDTFKKGKFHYHKKTKQRIFGILIVLSFGIVPDLNYLRLLKRKFNLKVILDAAAAHFSNSKNKISNYDFITCYSFNGNKNITSGGGGMLCTNNIKKFEIVKIKSNVGKKNKYEYSNIGYNYRLTNLNASIGYAQLKRFSSLKTKKHRINSYYNKNIKLKYVEKNKFNKFKLESIWIYYLILKKKNYLVKIIEFLKKKNIECGKFWVPLHTQKPYKKYLSEKMESTNLIFDKLIVIPSSTFLKKIDLKYIVERINSFS